jgi:catecholate siderophore receptor
LLRIISPAGGSVCPLPHIGPFRSGISHLDSDLQLTDHSVVEIYWIYWHTLLELQLSCNSSLEERASWIPLPEPHEDPVANRSAGDLSIVVDSPAFDKEREVSKKSRKKNTSSIGNAWPVAYKWVAMGTFVVYTAVGSKTVTLAYGQDPRSVLEAGQLTEQSSALPVRRFDIPPGLLDAVLSAFRNATGLRVEMVNQVIGSLSSPGVSGVYPVEQALRRLLAETGVSYRFTAAGSVTLELRGPETAIEVKERAETVPSPKYTAPLRDTPQSISVVPRQVMEDQGASTLRDALRNVAGISLAAGEGGAQGDNLTIRGFAARSDIFQDGMRDFGSYYRDPFNLEEVQVLKGPTSVTFGRGTTGGVVNEATKTPQLNRILGAALDFGSDLTRRVSLDLNQPAPMLGQGAAFRLNVMGNDSHVAGRDIAENRRFGFAPSLSLGLGSPTRLTLSYFHQSANDVPDYGIPWLFDRPAPVRRENYYGFKENNFLRTNVDIGTVRLEHDFNGAITVRNQTRFSYYTRDVLITEARLAGTVTPGTPLSAIGVTRGQIGVNSVEDFFQNQLDVTSRFRTGSIRHTLVAGVEAGREVSNPARPTFTGVPGTSLLNPDTDQAFSGASTITSRVHAKGLSAGVYALDTLRLGEHWDLTAGVRWDRFDARYRQDAPPASAFNRVDRMTSWRGAIVYKPAPSGSIYLSYGTSFNPSAESLSLSAANADTPPEKNRTYELGSKWDVASGKLSLRTSIFRTEKNNAREPDPNNPLQNVLSGKQRVQGFELEASGDLTSRWQVFSSYALLDSRLVRSQYYPAAIGSRLANVPRNTFSLWTTYELSRKLEIGGGPQFVDARTASSTAPTDPTTGRIKQLPGYWVVNAMAKYPLTKQLDLRLNLNNLGDKYYFDQIHPSHIVPGAGRTALLGINFKF